MPRTLHKFWMVWREGSPATRFQHVTRQTADEEAERLAKANPGEVFYVLKSMSAVSSKSQPITRHKLIADEIPF